MQEHWIRSQHKQLYLSADKSAEKERLLQNASKIARPGLSLIFIFSLALRQPLFSSFLDQQNPRNSPHPYASRSSEKTLACLLLPDFSTISTQIRALSFSVSPILSFASGFCAVFQLRFCGVCMCFELDLRFLRRNVVFEQRIGVSHTSVSRRREI